MDIDMYAFAIPLEDVADSPVDVQLRLREGEPLLTIAHWYGLGPLHHWMHQLYKRRGGRSGNYRETSLRLRSEDLQALEESMARQLSTSGHAPHIEDSTIYPEEMLSIRKFLSAARRSIQERHAVIYASFT